MTTIEAEQTVAPKKPGRKSKKQQKAVETQQSGTASDDTKKTKKRSKNWSFRLSFWLGLLILFGGIYVRYDDPPAIEAIRLKAFDQFNRSFPRVPVTPSPVVIIDLDEKSLGQIGQWPWPRTIFANLIETLFEQGVRVVGLDIIFPEFDQTSPEVWIKNFPSLDESVIAHISALPSNDAVLGHALSQHDVVLGQAASRTPVQETPSNKRAQETSVIGLSGPVTRFTLQQPFLIPNNATLEDNSNSRALFSVDEEVDGVVRRVPAVYQIGNVIKPALSFEMIRLFERGSGIIARANNSGMEFVSINSEVTKRLPVDSRGRFWVYYAPPDTFNRLDNNNRMYISASDVLNGKVGSDRLKDKIAIIGTSAIGLLDIRATPIAPRLPGVEIHANIIENIVQGEFLAYPGFMLVAEMGLALIVGLLLIFFIPRVGPIFTVIGLVTVIGSLLAISIYAFTEHRILIDNTVPSGLSLILYSVLAFANYAREAAEKRQVRMAFGQYLSPDLVEQLAENPDQLKLGGETKKMSILFCDVRGFTTISESFKTDPQGLTRLINRLLTPLTQEILIRQGTIDKYMGDCIMAFWNAPLETPDHPRLACEAGLAMFEVLDVLNEAREQEAKEAGTEHLPLKIGIGINSGSVVVGNMGSEQRFDYSVLGDAVNLASRLEGQSKGYFVDIVIGEETHDAVNDVMACLELDLIKVKGKKEAVRIFCVIGGQSMVRRNSFAEQKAAHENMMTKYREQKWDEAEKMINQMKTDGSFDGYMNSFYGMYLERISEFRKFPPGKEWDGVYMAASK